MTCKDCIHYEACKDWINETALQKYVEDNGCDKFKDKSRIVELPCKVGDTVYRVRRKPYTNKGYEIVEREVVSFDLRFRKGNPIWSIVTTAVDVFNKTVFLTRKQAEQALKERE